MENTITYKCPVCGTVLSVALSPLSGNGLYACPTTSCPIHYAEYMTLPEVKMLIGADRLTKALEEIVSFANANPGRGFTCGKMAAKALAESTI